MNVRDLQFPVFGAQTDQTDVRIWLRNDERDPRLLPTVPPNRSSESIALCGAASARFGSLRRGDRIDPTNNTTTTRRR